MIIIVLIFIRSLFLFFSWLLLIISLIVIASTSELLQIGLLGVHVLNPLHQQEHLRLRLSVLLPRNLELLLGGHVLCFGRGARVVLLLELLLHGHCRLIRD